MYTISKSEVLRYLGHKNQQITPDIDSLIDNMIKRVLSCSSPSYTYMVSDVLKEEGAIRLKGTNLLLTGKDILNHLNGAEKCITLACTLGLRFETEFLKIQAKSMAQSVIFDACGTALIESVADFAEENLLLPFKKEGYFSKFRYSPGYGDFPLSIQQEIIIALQCQKKIGLTVTETNILIPQKSITAFIGIFNTPQKKPASKCDICTSKEFCRMRKEGKTCD